MLGDWIADLPPNPKDFSLLAQFSELKRRALVVYEKSLEQGRLPNVEGTLKKEPEHPIWAVGSFARNYADYNGEAFGLTSDQAQVIGVGRDEPLGLGIVAMNWFWVGWILDPSLSNMSRDRQAQNGSYLAEMLWKGGPYPMHALYFASRRPLERRVITPNDALQPDFTAFVNDGNLAKFQPTNAAVRRRFVQGCRELLRMSCLLLVRDLRWGRRSANPTGARQQLTALWKYVAASDTAAENQATRPLVASALESLKAPAWRQTHPDGS